MSVVLTGADGFLGWHVASRLRATRAIEPVRLGRSAFEGGGLASAVSDADVLIHLAGVNRAGSESDVEEGNVALAHGLAHAVVASGRPLHLVYANSIQANATNAYGRGKAKAATILQNAVQRVGGSMSDVLLPNIFGEHGRPHYNSFVATFCHEVANGGSPEVSGDRAISLLHAQQAAEALILAGERRTEGTLEPTATPRLISEVLTQLEEFKVLYDRGEIPDLSTPFAVDLFNTYRSFTLPAEFTRSPSVHEDTRGRLFETLRMHGGTGQAFMSTTVPGATRGEHYHLRKVERFFVVSGEAEIALRRLYHNDVIRFRLSGETPSYVDMPTMWVHNIRNIGDRELVTMFWSDQLLDPNNTDQYAERVCPEEFV